MRALSATALDVIRTGAPYSGTLTVTRPGEDPITVEHTPGWSVTEKSVVAGTRLTISSLTILPTDGVDDLFAFAGYPGAVYDLSIGINLGGTIESVPVFHGRVVEGSSRRNAHGVTVTLTDDWQWFDGAKFTSAFSTAILTRAEQIVDIVAQVMPALTMVIDADGGQVCRPGVYTVSRGQAVSQLAEDGLLQVGFNNIGDFIVKAQPDALGNLTPVWQFSGGPDALDPNASSYPYGSGLYGDGVYGGPMRVVPAARSNIVAGTLERTRPWAESLINSVTVKPKGDWQTWTAQTANLTDTNDPRHENNVGYREIAIESNTIATAYDAFNLAQAVLTRKLRVTDERVKLAVVLNPAIEADDVVFISAPETISDAGWSGTYIVTSVTHSTSDATSSIEAVSASGYEMGT